MPKRKLTLSSEGSVKQHKASPKNTIEASVYEYQLTLLRGLHDTSCETVSRWSTGTEKLSNIAKFISIDTINNYLKSKLNEPNPLITKRVHYGGAIEGTIETAINFFLMHRMIDVLRAYILLSNDCEISYSDPTPLEYASDLRNQYDKTIIIQCLQRMIAALHRNVMSRGFSYDFAAVHDLYENIDPEWSEDTIRALLYSEMFYDEEIYLDFDRLQYYFLLNSLVPDMHWDALYEVIDLVDKVQFNDIHFERVHSRNWLRTCNMVAMSSVEILNLSILEASPESQEHLNVLINAYLQHRSKRDNRIQVLDLSTSCDLNEAPYEGNKHVEALLYLIKKMKPQILVLPENIRALDCGHVHAMLYDTIIISNVQSLVMSGIRYAGYITADDRSPFSEESLALLEAQFRLIQTLPITHLDYSNNPWNELISYHPKVLMDFKRALTGSHITCLSIGILSSSESDTIHELTALVRGNVLIEVDKERNKAPASLKKICTFFFKNKIEENAIKLDEIPAHLIEDIQHITYGVFEM